MSLYNNNEIIGLFCVKGHKFRYYCSDCHKNLCELNIQNHIDHTLINFDYINFEINSEVNELIIYLNQNNENDVEISNLSEEFEKKSYLIMNSDKKAIKIIRIIMDDYLNYPNYSHFFNIDNISKYLKKDLAIMKKKKKH